MPELGVELVCFFRSMVFPLAGVALMSCVAATEQMPLPDQARQPDAVWSENFDPPGEGGKLLLGMPLAHLAPGRGVNGTTALRVDYVGYERGSKRLVRNVPLGERLTEATLCYDVLFDEDFQFVRGGKLHGLGPLNPVAGGNPREPHRWSARINFSGDGGVRTYLYDQSDGSRWGRSTEPETAFRFERDQYYAVSLHMRVNTPGETDGFARIYVDGERVVNHDGVAFRGVYGEDTLIHSFLFSTFHGGSSSEWAPRDQEGNFATVHAYFDNMAVYRGRMIRTRPGI